MAAEAVLPPQREEQSQKRARREGPWKTLMPTCVWLSAAVENVCAFFVGMVVFLERERGAKTGRRPPMPDEGSEQDHGFENATGERVKRRAPMAFPAVLSRHFLISDRPQEARAWWDPQNQRRRIARCKSHQRRRGSAPRPTRFPPGRFE